MKRLLAALFIIVAGGALAACSAGHSGPSEAELELEKRNAAKNAVLKERLAQRNRELARERRRKDQAPSNPRAALPGGGLAFDRTCSDAPGLWITAKTSCGFAKDIRDAYWMNPSQGVYYVRSGETGRTYEVTCHGSGLIACTGGDRAGVQFWE